MNTFTCIICPKGCLLTAEESHGEITIVGSSCSRGMDYGKKESLCPSRILTTTIPVKGGALPVVPIKTVHSIPLASLKKAAAFLKALELNAPLQEGQVFNQKMDDLNLSFQITRDLSREEASRT